MTLRPLALLLLGGVAAATLAACGGDEGAAKPTAAPASDVAAALASPAPGEAPAVRRLDAKAGTLLPAAGAPPAQLKAELAKLRGTPVVVNVWAEWCAPCKRELPLLQQLALDRRGQLAMLGVASDRRAKAQELMEQIAMPYPSILDADGDVAAGNGVSSLPQTMFFDAQGKRVYLKLGEYKRLEDLQADVSRYLGLPERS